MRGRKPTPTRLKILLGNPGCRRIYPEPEPERLAECPEPPDCLGAYAAEEWRRVAPQLCALGLLTELDLPLLAVYAAAFERWRTAVELIEQTGAQGGLREPLAAIRKAAAEQMVRLAGEFAMTPRARTWLTRGSGRQARPSRFEGLIA
jgi:P27 family predicted phage terminase small subunit